MYWNVHDAAGGHVGRVRAVRKAKAISNAKRRFPSMSFVVALPWTNPKWVAQFKKKRATWATRGGAK